jgi:hypothetical protein
LPEILGDGNWAEKRQLEAWQILGVAFELDEAIILLLPERIFLSQKAHI